MGRDWIKTSETGEKICSKRKNVIAINVKKNKHVLVIRKKSLPLLTSPDHYQAKVLVPN